MEACRARSAESSWPRLLELLAGFLLRAGEGYRDALALRGPSAPVCSRLLRGFSEKALSAPVQTRLRGRAHSCSIAASTAVRRCSSAAVCRAAASSACCDSACCARGFLDEPCSPAGAAPPCAFPGALAPRRSWKHSRTLRASPLRAAQPDSRSAATDSPCASMRAARSASLARGLLDFDGERCGARIRAARLARD